MCKGPGVGRGAEQKGGQCGWKGEGSPEMGGEGQGQSMHSLAGHVGSSVFILSLGSQCRVLSRPGAG